MAARKTLNQANLEALGAARLAELLLDLAKDATVKRRLRLELSAESGAEAIAADLGKRLTTLRQAKSFIDWQKRAAFVKDLDLQRQLIVEKVSPDRPDLALDLLWRFMGLAGPALDRVDDSNGSVGDVFRQACLDLGAVAARAPSDPVRLADRVLEAVTTNEHGEYDRLVRTMLPALKDAGVARLKGSLAAALAKRPKPRTDSFDPEASALRRALQDIADYEGDVDAFIAHEGAPRSPQRAAAIATRLLKAGRATEALAILRKAAPKDLRPRDLEDEWAFGLLGADDWDLAWVAALEAAGRHDEAQRFRWDRFETRLDAQHLRAYLKALPDFEDVVAERRALDRALAFPSFPVALSFLVEWKALREAARLVLDRAAEIDGNLYFILDPAAKALEGKEPLAAVILRRALIEDTLEGAKAKRYKHAARHLQESRSLEPAIADHGRFGTHAAFLARMRARHARKAGFWSLLAEMEGASAPR